MKTAIVYCSVHHKNTEAVVRAMAQGRDIDLYTVGEAQNADLAGYDCIGLASGIYFSRFHRTLEAWVRETDVLHGKAVFFVYTCGLRHREFSARLRKALRGQGCRFLGVFYCRGYDTFGALKLFGGIAKGRPNARDLRRAEQFAESLPERFSRGG